MDIKDFEEKGLLDMGNGTAAVAIEQEAIDEFRRLDDYMAECIKRTVAVLEDLKSKGADRFEALTVLLKLSPLQPEAAEGLLYYTLGKQVFQDEEEE